MQQDYVLRMIQQLGGFVSGMLKLRQAGKAEQAIFLAQEGYGRFAGLSASLVHAVSEEDLVQLLRARGSLDPDRFWALAEILREEASAYDDLGSDGDSIPRFIKSLRLYLEVVHELDEMTSVINVSGMESVIDRAADFDLPAETRRRLIEFFEETGRYDRAENVVIWSLEWPDPDGSKRAGAVGLYQRLLARTDADLASAELTRVELEQGLANATDQSS